MIRGAHEVVDRTERIFHLASGGRLEIETDRASIHLRPGEPERVELDVEVRVRARGEELARAALERVRLEVRQEEGLLAIGSRVGEAERSGWLGRRHGCTVEAELRLTLGEGYDLSVVTDCGDLRVDRVDRRLTARANAGNVAVGTASGGIDVEVGAGSVHVRHAEGPVAVRTGAGNLIFEDLRGGFEAVTASGNILARIGAGPGKASRLESGAGSIGIEIAEGTGLELSASTLAGRILSDLPLSSEERGAAARFSGTIHGGGAALTARTSSGNIFIGDIRAAMAFRWAAGRVAGC